MTALRAIFVGAALAALTACGGERVVVVKPPVDLTHCADEPVAPDLPPPAMQALRDQMMLAYVLAFRSAWGDCRAKVEGLRAWSDGL